MEKNLFVMPVASVTASDISNGIPDAENQVYDAGTTYSIGDLVWYSGNVWESLTDSNTGNTPVEGANWTDKGQVDQGADKWVSGTYALDVFKVLNGRVWKSAKNSNTSTPGATDATANDWTDLGATNRMRPFNGFIQQPATGTGKIEWTFTVAARVTEIILFAAKGGTVRVQCRRPGGELVFDKSQFTNRSTSSFFDYHWSPISVKSNLVFSGIPPYANMQITVSIEAVGDTSVSLGLICAGFPRARATVITGSGLGLESRSIKEENTFGVPSIVKFPASRIVSFNVIADIRDSDEIFNELSALDAIPSAYFMRNGQDLGMVVYGLFEDFYLSFDNTVKSEFVLEIKGFAE